MSSPPRSRYVPPRQPGAEPICLLDKEWAQRRAEPPDAFLALSTSESTDPDGASFRFPAAPGMWERVQTFVDEEGECCPFFAFEQSEDGGEIVLRIFQPGAAK
jgi:hypothetical protein